MEEKLKFEGIYNEGELGREPGVVMYTKVYLRDKADNDTLALDKEELLPLAAFLIAAYNYLNDKTPSCCGSTAKVGGKCFGCGAGVCLMDQPKP